MMDGSNSIAASVQDAISELENTSIVFRDSWEKIPQDLDKAAEASSKAMKCLDHLIDRFLHARNTQMAKEQYAGSQLQNELHKTCGVIVAKVTTEQQQALVDSGPGAGTLPVEGAPIEFESLLNKLKYRQEQAGNFRIDEGRHIFLVNVDKKDRTPDSIVEFEVVEFAAHCKAVAKFLY